MGLSVWMRLAGVMVLLGVSAALAAETEKAAGPAQNTPALAPATAAAAPDVLLIGNSFTQSIPRFLTPIATAGEHPLAVKTLAVGGKNFGYHLAQEGTPKMLAQKKWKAVVLQDQSVEPTHVGNVKKFLADGETFYRKIRELAPDATVVLYETWALEKTNGIFTKESTARTFATPAEMTAELAKSYGELAQKLEDIEPGKQVAVAPVGSAFARSLELYPDLQLHGPDRKHASDLGHYLASLVIYSAITGESPVGPAPTPGLKIPADTATKLQKVAGEVLKARRESK